jgi:hypothetical protein
LESRDWLYLWADHLLEEHLELSRIVKPHYSFIEISRYGPSVTAHLQRNHPKISDFLLFLIEFLCLGLERQQGPFKIRFEQLPHYAEPKLACLLYKIIGLESSKVQAHILDLPHGLEHVADGLQHLLLGVGLHALIVDCL